MWRVRAAVALSLCAGVGCSSIFDLDHFDEGSGSGADQRTTTETGATNSITEREAGVAAPATTNTESDAGNGVDASAKVDAGCASEIESNDTTNTANTIGPGSTCAMISGPGDVDVFKFHFDATTQFSIKVAANLAWSIDDGAETGGGGNNSFPLPAGDHKIMVTASTSQSGTYVITLPQ